MATEFATRIKNAQSHNEEISKLQKAKIEDLRSDYKACFGNKAGEKIVDDLVETYLTRSVTGKMSPNEIMFLEGQNSVVKRILTILTKQE